MARPITYRTDLAEAVLRNIESGDNVSEACRRAGVARTTFATWGKAGRLGQLGDRLSRARANARGAPTREAAPEPPNVTPAGSARGAHDQLAAWLAANRNRLADRRARATGAGSAGASTRSENSEQPEIVATYTPNRTALMLVARVLEAVAAELRRAT
jgi:transposase-like protein